MKRFRKITAFIMAAACLIGMLLAVRAVDRPPVITAAYVVSDTQIRVEFSAPVAFDSAKSTRFAMRIIDANNNMVSGTKDAYTSSPASYFTWVSEEHRALIWTVAAGEGHPATTAHWLEVAQGLQAGQRVAFCIIDMTTTGDANIDAVTLKENSGVYMQKMNTSGAGQAVCELTATAPAAAPELVAAEAVSDTTLKITFSCPVDFDFANASTRFALRVLDDTDNMVSGTTDAYSTMTAEKFEWADDTHTAIYWDVAAGTGHPASATHWLELAGTLPEGQYVGFCVIDVSATNTDENINGVRSAEDASVFLKRTNSGTGTGVAAVALTSSITAPAPRLIAADAVSDSKLKITFSTSVAIDFETCATRFSVRIVDDAGNIVSGTTDAFQTMTAEKFEWANEEHTAIYWNIAAGEAHPASAGHWLGLAETLPEGQRIAFAVIDISATSTDSKIDSIVNADAPEMALLRSNTSGNAAAVIELTDARPAVDAIRIVSAKEVDDGHILLTFSGGISVIGNPQIALTLTDADHHVVSDSAGAAQVFGGAWEFTDETQTAILWRPLFTNARGVKTLAELFEFKGGVSEFKNSGYTWQFRIAEVASSEFSVINGNGYIENLVGLDGNPVESTHIDPTYKSAESIFMPVHCKYPSGGLTVTSCKAVDDAHIEITFSAPIERTPGTFMAVRLVDEKNEIVTQEHEGEDPVYMQWTGTWEFTDKTQTAIRWQFYSKNKFNINNLVDLFHYKNIEEYKNDKYSLVFYMGESAEQAGQNGLIDNIYRADDPAVHLTGNHLSSQDGLDLTVDCEFSLRKIGMTAEVLNEQQVMLTFSEPVKFMGGEPFLAIRYMRYGEQYFDGEFNNSITVQFDGKWEWADESHTRILWTMKGQNRYGGFNLSDVFLHNNGLARFDDATIAFCVEEVLDLEKGFRPGTDLIENIASLDGRAHLEGAYSLKIGGPDRCYIPIRNDLPTEKVTLDKVIAVDDQTLELHFSEEVIIAEGENAPSVAIRYIDEMGNTGVCVDGKLAYFRGTVTYKEGSRNVLIWKLDVSKARGAQNLSDIFNYAGNLRFNNDLTPVFAILDPEENPGCAWDMRVDGVTDVTGRRKLVATKLGEYGIVFKDIDIQYDLPKAEEETEGPAQEEISAQSDYTAPIIGAAAIAVLVPFGALIFVRPKKRKGA